MSRKDIFWISLMAIGASAAGFCFYKANGTEIQSAHVMFGLWMKSFLVCAGVMIVAPPCFMIGKMKH